MKPSSTEPIRPATAQEICDRFELSPAAEMLLRGEQAPQPFFAELTKAQLFDDAVRFAAEFLTPREAVWWGALCLWQGLRGEQMSAGDLAGLRCVVDWVQRPDEARRRQLELAMHASDSSPLVRNLALAAFYSGGSISLADQPEVAPPVGQTAGSVAATVTMASRLAPPRLHQQCMLHFLKLASEISRGEAGWDDPDASPTSLTPPEYSHAART